MSAVAAGAAVLDIDCPVAQGVKPLSSRSSLTSSAADEAGGTSDWEPSLHAATPVCSRENQNRARKMRKIGKRSC